MSCCLIVKDKNNLFIGADSAITMIDKGKMVRVGNNAEKVFYIDKHAFFCSGNIVYSELVKLYILKNKCTDEFEISQFIKSISIDKQEGINSLELIMCNMEKIVQISEYNNFNPVYLKNSEHGVQIYSTGFKTEECLKYANDFIESRCDVYKVFENTFRKISCSEVGGSLKVINVLNGSEKMFNIDNVPVKYKKLKTMHYINTEVLMGRMVASSQLIVANESGTFLVDGEGVTLINAKLIIRNEDGSESTVDEELGNLDNKIDQTIIDNSENLGNAISSLEGKINVELNKKVTTYYDSKTPSSPNLGDLWFDTSTVNGSSKNKLNRWNGSEWIPITDKQIIDAIDKAENAQDTADKKIVTYYQTTQPTEAHIGDLWIDTDDGNKMYRFDGVTWLDISYKGINAETAKEIQGALDKIKDVQDVVDGKIEIYYSASEPDGAKQGDIWVDIGLNGKGKPKNKMYRYDQSQWVLIEDDNIENIFTELGQLESAIDGKVTTYYGTLEELPAASKLNDGDLWVDTSNHNKLMIRQGNAWVDVSIGGEDLNEDVLQALNKSQEALTKAEQALSMADGMVNTYYQSEQPKDAQVGDIWINSKTGRVNILTSSGWKETQDQSIKDLIDETNKILGIANSKTTTYYQDEMPTQGKIGDIWIDTDDGNKVYIHNGSTFVLTLGDLITDNDMLLSNIYDGFFDHGKKFWSNDYRGQVVQSTEIGNITDEGISGGKAFEIQGEHTLYAKNAIPVETNRTFKFILKIKQKKHATTGWTMAKWKGLPLSDVKSKRISELVRYNTDEMLIDAGVVCLDAQYNLIGTPKAFIARGKLIRPSDNWIILEGIITGTGTEQSKFSEGVKYIRPFFSVNKPNGTGTVLIDSLVMKDITEGKQAQDSVDKVEDKLDNVLTIEGNVSTSKLEGTLNAHVNAILSGANMQVVMDKDGIWAMNNADKKLATKVVAMNENGIVMAKERINGELSWRTAISAEGINADEINTGTLRALNITGCNFEVSNERGKVLINPTDGIKIQKKSGSTWSDTLYIDTDGDAVFKGKLVGNSLNINNNFTVDRSGNVVAKSIKISGAASELDAKDMVVRNLVVGENVIMGENAVISWGNLPDDVAGMTDIPTDSKIQNIAKSQVPSYITSTKITRTEIESPTIKGGLLHQYNSRGGVLLSDGTIVIENDYQNAIGAIYYDSAYKMYIMSNYGNPMRIESGEHMAITVPSGKKINLEGHVVVKGGKITDEYGNNITGNSTAVFG